MRNYLVKTLNGMALGLFGSLIIGLILKQLGDLSGITYFTQFGKVAQFLMGPAIGASVAYSVGASPLGIVAAMVSATIGAGTIFENEAGLMVIKIGEPMGAFVSGLAAAEFSKVISGKTKVDIVVVPALTILLGGIIGVFIAPIISAIMNGLGVFINTATELHPIPMGMIVAVVVGMILTLPISSAALAISLGLTGIAGGAALIGCCCQMIGFAVISHKENGWGGTIAQGLGTSMLQVPNIIKNPKIWIPPIFASVVLGPISTAFFKLESNSIGAGMGTSGLVGQFGAYAAMGERMGFSEFLIKITTMHFILPALLTFIAYYGMIKKGWINKGDLTLPSTSKS